MVSLTDLLVGLLLLHTPMTAFGVLLEVVSRYYGDTEGMEATTLDRLLLCARFPIFVCHTFVASVVLQATPRRHRERVLGPANWVMRSYGSRFFFAEDEDDERWVRGLVMTGDAPLGGR